MLGAFKLNIFFNISSLNSNFDDTFPIRKLIGAKTQGLISIFALIATDDVPAPQLPLLLS